MKKPSPIVSYLVGIGAAILFGMNGVIIKLFMEGTGFTGVQVTLFRVMGAGLIMGLVLSIRSPRELIVPRRSILPTIAMGIFGLATLQATYAYAVYLLPVGIALLIEYTAVLAVALIAHFFFKEHIKPRIWWAIVLVLGGLATVAEVWETSLNFEGVLWAIGASASLTTYFVLGESQTGTMKPMAVGFWTMLVASVFWAVLTDWSKIDWSALGNIVPFSGYETGPAGPAWFLLFFIIVIGTFATFAMSLYALSGLKATQAGIVATSEVLFAFLAAFLLIGETLNLVQLIGAATVLVGVIFAQTSRTNHSVDADLALTVSKK